MAFSDLMVTAQKIQDLACELAEQQLYTGSPYWTPTSKDLKWARAPYQDIASLFAPFLSTPDPATFDTPIQHLSSALDKLSSGQTTVDPISTNGAIHPANPALEQMAGAGGVGADLQAWTGAAADAFRKGYVQPFPAIVHNQFLLVAALKAALEAEKAMWEATRTDIAKLADLSYAKLKHINDCHQGSFTMFFTVVASIAAVVAAPLSFGTSTTALVAGVTSITAVGAASQTVAAIQIKPAPETPITGSSVQTAVASIRDLIKMQTQHVIETETTIAEKLTAINNMIMQHQASTNPLDNIFYTKRPNLVDTTNATDIEYPR